MSCAARGDGEAQPLQGDSDPLEGAEGVWTAQLSSGEIDPLGFAAAHTPALLTEWKTLWASGRGSP